MILNLLHVWDWWLLFGFFLFQVYNLSQNVQEDDLQHLQVSLGIENCSHYVKRNKTKSINRVWMNTMDK